MPLNENTRLSRDMREKIRHLLRSFYNRLLVERIPDRIFATVNARAHVEGSASAPLPPSGRSGSSENLP